MQDVIRKLTLFYHLIPQRGLIPRNLLRLAIAFFRFKQRCLPQVDSFLHENYRRRHMFV